MQKITVETTVHASREIVWTLFTEPHHIMKWNHASEDWHSPRVINNLTVGGMFNYRMESKDTQEGFDFEGTYTEIIPFELIAYTMSGNDARKVHVEFHDHSGTTHVVVTFDAENENPIEMQESGWQSILNNFKMYAESSAD